MRRANLLKTAVSVLASTVRLTVSFMEPLMTVSVMLRCSKQDVSSTAVDPSQSFDDEDEGGGASAHSQPSHSDKAKQPTRSQHGSWTQTVLYANSPSGRIGALTPSGSTVSMLVSMAMGELHLKGSLGLKTERKGSDFKAMAVREAGRGGGGSVPHGREAGEVGPARLCAGWCSRCRSRAPRRFWGNICARRQRGGRIRVAGAGDGSCCHPRIHRHVVEVGRPHWSFRDRHSVQTSNAA